MKNKISAIITAAGKGERMNSSVKKQFMLFAGKPIVIHTIEKFLKADIFYKILVTLNPEDMQFARKLFFNEYKFPQNKFIIVNGGETRQQSVLNALKFCPSSVEIVVIHDGVRPFVKIEEIKEIVKISKEKGAVTIGLPAKNTIKTVAHHRVLSTLKREQLWEIFTPQAFRFQIIYDAHQQSLDTGFFANDDAELVEKIGVPVFVLEGSPENIKITNKFDLKIAEAIMSKNMNSTQ